MTGLAHQQQRSSNGPASARRADGSEIQDRSPTARSSGEPSNGDTEAALEQAGGADGCTDSDDADDYGDDDDDNFDVECIVAEKWDQKSRRMLYLVHWKGFEEKDYTWEPKKHFHAPDTLSDWEALKLHTPAHKRFDWKAWDRRFGIDHENQDGEPSNQEPEDEQSGRSWRNSFSRLSPDQKSTTPIHDDPKIEDPSRNNTCSQIHRSQATAIDVARSPVDQNDAAILLESSILSRTLQNERKTASENTDSSTSAVVVRSGTDTGNLAKPLDNCALEQPTQSPIAHEKLNASLRVRQGTSSSVAVDSSEGLPPPEHISTECYPPVSIGDIIGYQTGPGSASKIPPSYLSLDARTPEPEEFTCTLSIYEGALRVQGSSRLVGLSLKFRRHLRKLGIQGLMINGFVSFEYLDKVIVQESGLPVDGAVVKTNAELNDGFITHLSELQGAAVVLEKTFSILFAPSHSHKFHHIFNIQASPSHEMSAVVYPPLDLDFVNTHISPSKLEFPGRFILESANWDFDSQNSELSQHQHAHIVVLPSACASKYGLDVACSFEAYRQKISGNGQSLPDDRILLQPYDVLSQKTIGKLHTASSFYLFLMHTSLVRNLHLIPNLALLRTLKYRTFLSFGPELGLGSSSINWNIRQIFFSGGVLLLTLELILLQATKVLEILELVSTPTSISTWALAVPQNISGLLDQALAMSSVRQRLSVEDVESCSHILLQLRSIGRGRTVPHGFHVLDVSAKSDVNYTENCVDAFIQFQIEWSQKYRSFAVICGSGLTDKKSLERQYTNLDIFEIDNFLELLRTV